ncbi:MAG TPA: CBS domain-containing protein [Jiangellaceae bacterium]|nr:CBS domain-containing protein [Jiangellaceae bacterium]
MLAHEIMTSPAITADSELPVKEAIRLLDRHEITALPVIDDESRLVGIVSEADLLRGELISDPRAHVRATGDEEEPSPKTVADVMTTGVLAVHESTDAADIARLMLDTGVKSIPVVRGQRVVGIVSRRDLIRVLAVSDDQIRDDIHRLFAEAGMDGWTATVTDGHVELSGHGPDRDARVAAILARTVAGVSRVHGPSDPRREPVQSD